MAHLIDKDAVVAEIDRLENKLYYEPENFKDVGAKMALDSLKSSLDTLEVKEVDLEKELIEWHKEHFKKDGTFIRMSGFYLTNNSQMDIAKHFFELGMLSTITEEDCKLIWNIGDDLPYMPEEDFFKELLRRYKAQKGEEYMFIEHPDGGHCNTEGMTSDCYGCICYGGGLIEECKKRVKQLKSLKAQKGE